MKSIKQLPLLATSGAMVLVFLGANADWVRIAAVIICLSALGIFAKDNLKKDDQ